MRIECVWEHHGHDSLLYAASFPGAFTRGPSKEAAMGKMPVEISAFLRWRGIDVPDAFQVEIVQEKSSALTIADADSDVLFDGEREALSLEEYLSFKEAALKSARDFLALYLEVPDPHRTCLPVRHTFYGPIPRTAFEMYEHTKNVNAYYFGEIGVSADNEGTILACRERGFASLETRPDFLNMGVRLGSYDEEWSLRKVMRRFIWHDRIHAKAMYRMAVRTFGKAYVPDVFSFGE